MNCGIRAQPGNPLHTVWRGNYRFIDQEPAFSGRKAGVDCATDAGGLGRSIRAESRPVDEVRCEGRVVPGVPAAGRWPDGSRPPRIESRLIN